MATATVNCSYNRYNRNSGALWTPYSDTDLFAGKNNDGTYSYRIFLGFPITGFSGTIVGAATLSMYRFLRDSTTAKTLYIRVVDSVNEANGDYATVDTNVVTWPVTAGAGRKTVSIAALFPALAASASRRLMLYGTSNSSYTEFYAYTTQSIHIDLVYNHPFQIKVAGAWKYTNLQNSRIKAGGAWRAIASARIKVAGIWKTIL